MLVKIYDMWLDPHDVMVIERRSAYSSRLHMRGSDIKLLVNESPDDVAQAINDALEKQNEPTF